MTEPLDRRAALLATKLRVLVAQRWPDVRPEAEPGGFPDGATLVEPHGGRGWILLDDQAEARLGGALALAVRRGIGELHLLVDDAEGAAVLARRAALVAEPPTVWRVAGTELVAADPAPPAVDVPPAPEAELYRPVLEAHGLVPVVEGGNLVGELLGLEVARVVVDEAGSRVEAGVGRFDREAGSMMFAHLGEGDALARVVDVVARTRRPGTDRHPLNQLVPERWLRAVVLAAPHLVGAAELHAVGSARPRQNLHEVGVATAVGTDLAGEPLVVTCSTGVHLDLVPSAADDRLAHAPGARLVLAVPAHDALAVTTELAGRLARPATVVAVADDWRSAAEGAR